MFLIKLSDQAEKDFYTYIDYIKNEYKSPLTAIRHYEELSKIINSLKIAALAYCVRSEQTLQIYGHFVRRVNYKKMAIIYSVYENTVYIHRIIAGALIL